MTQQLSNCCKAPAIVSSSDEGTSCFMCDGCNKPCDLYRANRLMIAVEFYASDVTQQNKWGVFSQDHYAVIERKELDRIKRLDENVNKLISELKLIYGEKPPSILTKLLKGLYDE